jgi:hypothetical protein
MHAMRYPCSSSFLDRDASSSSVGLETFPIISGGGMSDDQIRQYGGVDYWMPAAMAGVRLCEELLSRK